MHTHTHTQKRTCTHILTHAHTHTHLSRCWVLPQQACRVVPAHSSTSGLSSCKLGCRQGTTTQPNMQRPGRLTDTLTVAWILKRNNVVYRGNVTRTPVCQLCVGDSFSLHQKCAVLVTHKTRFVPLPITVSCTATRLTSATIYIQGIQSDWFLFCLVYCRIH